jgi:hypothetical protein
LYANQNQKFFPTVMHFIWVPCFHCFPFFSREKMCFPWIEEK